MEGKCYRQAIWAFEMAIKKRPEDEWMTRTYGMHFVDYFPHRELGITYYWLNDYSNALKELKHSIQNASSDKAITFLDKVRTRILLVQKKEISTPELNIFQFEQSTVLWTNSDPVIISGMATDDAFVKKVAVSGRPVFMEGAQKKFEFEEHLDLSEGKHELLILAENLPGKTIERKVMIHVDRTGPVIMVNKKDLNEKIEGFIYDNSGNIELQVDKIPYSVPVGNKVPFLIHWNNKQSIVLVARDKAGNQTKAIFYRDQASDENSCDSNWIARNDTGQSMISENSLQAIKPPEITIDDPLESRIIYSDKIVISGHVDSETEIQALTINQDTVINEKGYNIFFSKIIPLTLEKNTVLIKTIDKTGKATIKELKLIRHQKEVFKHQYRLGIKLYPFEFMGDILEANVFNKKLLYNLVERKRFRMFASGDFQDFNIINVKHELAQPESNFYYFKGNIYMGESGALQVVGRVFSLKSEIIDVVDAYKEFEQSIPLNKKLVYMVQRISEKLHRKFPLVSGIITQESDKGYTIQPQKWYYGKGPLRLGSSVLIYRSENSENVDNSNTNILGKSYIVYLEKDVFKIHVINKTISIGDEVITQ